MKKFSALLLMVLLSTPIFAGDFVFGLKAAPGLSWFRTETRGYDNDGVGLAFSYGLMLDYSFAENYAVSSGINIQRSGGSMNYPYIHEGELTNKRSDYKFRYLELPLTLKLRSTEVGYMTYYGQFGMGVGFNTSAKADQHIRISDDSTLRHDDVDVTDQTKFLHAALILGAGIEYNLGGRTNLLAGLQFHNGFANVLDVENEAVNTTPSAVSNRVLLVLGVVF
ncbi:MAG: porin family protein [Bacteroidota bacterium]